MEEKKSVIEQTARGVEHLHSLDIIHRDLSPSNILLQICPSQRGKLLVKVSDFDRSKQLLDDRSSVTVSDGAKHSQQWMAPEFLESSSNKTVTKKADIFSLGCIFYYVLSNGQHPFGEPEFRVRNIKQKVKPCTNALGYKETDEVNSIGLVMNMIASDPSDRPSAVKLCRHVFFWKQQEQLEFIQEIVTYLENHKERYVLTKLKEHQHLIIGDDGWKEKLGTQLKEDLVNRQTFQGTHVIYNEMSLRDLIRTIRNKRVHFWHYDTTTQVRAELGEEPEKFMEYFNSRFPTLLIYLYTQMDGKLSKYLSLRFYGIYKTESTYKLHISPA